MTGHIQHNMNPLHIYCRLRNIGIPIYPARIIGQWYEDSIFRCFILPLFWILTTLGGGKAGNSRRVIDRGDRIGNRGADVSISRA